MPHSRANAACKVNASGCRCVEEDGQRRVKTKASKQNRSIRTGRKISPGIRAARHTLAVNSGSGHGCAAAFVEQKLHRSRRGRARSPIRGSAARLRPPAEGLSAKLPRRAAAGPQSGEIVAPSNLSRSRALINHRRCPPCLASDRPCATAANRNGIFWVWRSGHRGVICPGHLIRTTFARLASIRLWLRTSLQ